MQLLYTLPTTNFDSTLNAAGSNVNIITAGTNLNGVIIKRVQIFAQCFEVNSLVSMDINAGSSRIAGLRLETNPFQNYAQRLFFSDKEYLVPAGVAIQRSNSNVTASSGYLHFELSVVIL